MINLDKFIFSRNITFRQTNLSGCKGFAIKNSNGYVILLNSCISEGEQIKTAVHELCHIALGHLDDRQDIPDDEKESEVIEEMAKLNF